MKKSLFYSFLVIFVATAVITLLGVVQIVTIEEQYLKTLFIALIVELVGAVVVLFRKTDFGSLDENEQDRVKAIYQELKKFAILEDRTKTTEVFERLKPETKSIKVLAISSMTSILNANIQEKFRGLKQANIKWLFLNPNSNGVEQRVKENPTRNTEGLRHHIFSGIELINNSIKQDGQKKIEIRLYDTHPVFRIIILDDEIYVSFYPRGSAKDIPVYVFHRDETWIYEAMEKYFDTIWEKSEEFKPNKGLNSDL